MPAVQPAPEHGLFRLDRFRTAIHYVETPNYSERTGELQDDLRRRLEQSTFWTIKYGLINAEEELDRISALQPDWDSYGAAAPNDDALRATKAMLEELAGALVLPSTIVPSAEGGISIYFITENRTAYLENSNQGSQVLVLYDQNGNTEVFEVGRDINRSDVAHRILAYLG